MRNQIMAAALVLVLLPTGAQAQDIELPELNPGDLPESPQEAIDLAIRILSEYDGILLSSICYEFELLDWHDIGTGFEVRDMGEAVEVKIAGYGSGRSADGAENEPKTWGEGHHVVTASQKGGGCQLDIS